MPQVLGTWSRNAVTYFVRSSFCQKTPIPPSTKDVNFRSYSNAHDTGNWSFVKEYLDLPDYPPLASGLNRVAPLQGWPRREPLPAWPIIPGGSGRLVEC